MQRVFPQVPPEHALHLPLRQLREHSRRRTHELRLDVVEASDQSDAVADAEATGERIPGKDLVHRIHLVHVV